LRTDPAYQALAQRCLQLLSGKQLVDTIYLDVINGKYIDLVDPSAVYLPADRYSDLDKHEAAILEHCNENHPDQRAASLDAITIPRRPTATTRP